LILNGRGRQAVVPVVPQSLSSAPVTAGTGPALSSYDRNAAFMSFHPRESGIHAVWPGADEASVTEVRFQCTPSSMSEISKHAEVVA
jgi:hypothetical protein